MFRRDAAVVAAEEAAQGVGYRLFYLTAGVGFVLQLGLEGGFAEDVDLFRGEVSFWRVF